MNEQEIFENYKTMADVFAYKYRFKGELEDIKQVAYESLIIAARKYDETKGYAFASYAKGIMWKRIWNHLNNDSQIKVSKPLYELAMKLKTFDYFDMSIQDLVLKTGSTEYQIKGALNYLSTKTMSTNQELNSEDGYNTLGDVLKDESSEYDNLYLDIEKFKLTLKERELKVFEMRMEEMSTYEIAAALNTYQTTIARDMKKIRNKYNEYFLNN